MKLRLNGSITLILNNLRGGGGNPLPEKIEELFYQPSTTLNNIPWEVEPWFEEFLSHAVDITNMNETEVINLCKSKDNYYSPNLFILIQEPAENRDVYLLDLSFNINMRIEAYGSLYKYATNTPI